MDNATNSKIIVEKLTGYWEWLLNDTKVVGMCVMALCLRYYQLIYYH